MSISNKTGSPVAGDDFFDRETEFKKLIRSIQSGDHVLISAPRRVGKSSLMKKALLWAKEKEWKSVEIDVQDCADEADFLESLIEGFRNAGFKDGVMDKASSAAHGLKKFLAGTQLGTAGIGIEVPHSEDNGWKRAADLVEKAMVQMANQHRVLVGMDEFPIFLARLLKSDSEHGSARVELILHWFRSVRQKHHETITWLLCGSVGLDTFAEQHNLAGSINDLTLQTLGAFSRETAKQFLQHLSDSPRTDLELNEAAIDQMLECIGWPLPYFLQLMFQVVEDLPPEYRTKEYPSPPDVIKAQEMLTSASHSKYFVHWKSRLRDQLTLEHAQTCESILECLSKYRNGRSKAKLMEWMQQRYPHQGEEAWMRHLTQLLDILERDGYLMRSKTVYRFRSFLLREYWKRQS